MPSQNEFEPRPDSTAYARAVSARHRAQDLATRRRALVDAFRNGGRLTAASDRKQLQQSVRAYADLLRERGMLPEAMLLEIKAAARDALTLPTPEGRDMMELAVKWAIAAYYEDGRG